VAERAGQAAAVVELVAGRALAAGVQVLVGDEPLAFKWGIEIVFLNGVYNSFLNIKKILT